MRYDFLKIPDLLGFLLRLLDKVRTRPFGIDLLTEHQVLTVLACTILPSSLLGSPYHSIDLTS